MKNLITCLVVSALSSAVIADTWTVDDDGKADFNNIQAAIDAASDGDEIVVMPGTYPELINLGGRNIVVRSSLGPEGTILDGSGLNGPIVSLVSGEVDCLIEGLTLQNASGYQGGGIYINNSAAVIRECIVKNNFASYGAGFYIGVDDESIPTSRLEDCVFSNNTATHWNDTINSETSQQHSITGCTFTDESSYHGGILMGNTQINDCLFTGCSGSMFEVGIIADGCTITDCVFSGNSSGSLLGAVSSFPPEDVVFDNCTFSDLDGTALAYPSGSEVTVGNSSFCGINPTPWSSSVTDAGGNTTCVGPNCLDADGNGIPDECEPECPDINVDGIVDVNDLLILIADWGNCTDNCAGDLNEDGTVDIEDLLILIAAWGPCP